MFRLTRTFWQRSAIFCFALGFLSLVSSVLLTVIARLTASGLFGAAATLAIIAPIPLLMLGAHCLDKLDLLEKAKKKKQFKI